MRLELLGTISNPRPVLAADVFDEQLLTLNEQHRVSTRHRRVCQLNVIAWVSSDPDFGAVLWNVNAIVGRAIRHNSNVKMPGGP